MAFSRHALAQRARRSAQSTVIVAIVGLLGACSSSRTGDPDAGTIERCGPLMRCDGGSLDASSVDSSRPDLGPDGFLDADVRDAGPPRPICEAQDAHEATCPAALCDGPDSWYWNGDRCFPVTCGACEGTDCGTRFGSEAECENVHMACEPTMCRATGGDWLFWAEECGHFVCGRAVPATCLVGRAVCDCGPLDVFDPALGCVRDVSCTMGPPLPTRELVCTGSGGAWEAICCDTVCGAFCPLACASPACNCGAGRVFDEARGCIQSSRCYERTLGETCSSAARCDAGTICCQTCGGDGCVGEHTCRAPLCDTDPATDECGNNPLAP